MYGKGTQVAQRNGLLCGPKRQGVPQMKRSLVLNSRRAAKYL
jgi:hypothetical protein